MCSINNTPPKEVLDSVKLLKNEINKFDWKKIREEGEKMEEIEAEIKSKIDIIKSELAKVSDLDIRKDGEKLHRELSNISVEDLIRPFTI